MFGIFNVSIFLSTVPRNFPESIFRIQQTCWIFGATETHTTALCTSRKKRKLFHVYLQWRSVAFICAEVHVRSIRRARWASVASAAASAAPTDQKTRRLHAQSCCGCASEAVSLSRATAEQY